MADNIEQQLEQIKMALSVLVVSLDGLKNQVRPIFDDINRIEKMYTDSKEAKALDKPQVQ